MPFSRTLVATTIFYLHLPWIASAAETSAAFIAALESITAPELQSHVDYLADDQRQGREAGTRGSREAADYLIAQLQALGLRGAGIDGTYDQPFAPNFRNVLAILEGSDPKLKDEYVVLSAHYDHVGLGTRRNSKGPVGEIHNGADDNASGTSGVLEVLEGLTMLPQPPRRSVLVGFWDAEEKGMLGSKHWVAHPTVPLEQVRVLLNMDMIGRLRNDRMIVMGSRTGYGLRRLLSENNAQPDLFLQFPVSVLANTDHHPFFVQGIPAVTFHTDVHDDYHRPTDDPDRIDSHGMRRVTQLMFRLIYDLTSRDSLPAFREASRQETDDKPQLLPQKPAMPVRLGATWTGEQPAGPGVQLKSITHPSPAQRAGLRPGDRIVELAGCRIDSGEDLIRAVATAESPAKAVVVRAGHEEPVEVRVDLEGEPMRLGVTWRVDDAEPGVMILTHVVPGSPADQAGLQTEDRVYRVAGHYLSDEAHFAQLTATLPGPLEMLIEREGRVRRVVVHVKTTPGKRAA
jgi:hypothetical protein